MKGGAMVDATKLLEIGSEIGRLAESINPTSMSFSLSKLCIQLSGTNDVDLFNTIPAPAEVDAESWQDYTGVSKTVNGVKYLVLIDKRKEQGA